jgi:hypothetical protein
MKTRLMNLLYEYRKTMILLRGLPYGTSQRKEAKQRLHEIYVDLVDHHYKDIPKKIRKLLNLKPRVKKTTKLPPASEA